MEYRSVTPHFHNTRRWNSCGVISRHFVHQVQCCLDKSENYSSKKNFWSYFMKCSHIVFLFSKYASHQKRILSCTSSVPSIMHPSSPNLSMYILWLCVITNNYCSTFLAEIMKNRKQNLENIGNISKIF